MIDTAIILAAGLGTRLAPLSCVRAKAALPVGGEVLIRRQIRWLAAAGVTKVVVNLHHLPETLTSRLGHGDDLGVSVRYSWEPVVLGSAGGPRLAFDLVDVERAFIVNGDMVTDVDLDALRADHERHHPLVTLAAIDALAGYNSLVVDDTGALVGVTRSGQTPTAAHATRRSAHFIGVQIAERRAFAGASPTAPSETLKWLYPRLLAADPSCVRVWSSHAAYHDIGSPADYVATAATIARALHRPLDRGSDVTVAPSAVVENTVIWDRVSVGEGAVVRECVLADDVAIPAGLELHRVAVVPRSSVAGAAPGTPEGNLWIAPLDESAG